MSYWGKDCGYDITMLTYDQRSHSLIYPIYQRVYHIDLDYLFIALYQYFYLTCLLKNNKSSESAITQIKERKYDDILQHYRGEMLFVGINYDEKSKVHECRIEKLYALEK